MSERPDGRLGLVRAGGAGVALVRAGGVLLDVRGSGARVLVGGGRGRRVRGRGPLDAVKGEIVDAAALLCAGDKVEHVYASILPGGGCAGASKAGAAE